MNRLIFLGVGRRVELLQSFVEARQRAALSGSLEIWAVDADRRAPALRFADRAAIAPLLGHPSHDAFIEDLVAGAQCDMVPLIDPYVSYLSQLTPTERLRLWTVPPKYNLVIQDKWRTHQFFERHGIPTPRTILPDTDRIPFPAVVKPRFGSAGKDVFIVESDAEADLALQLVDDPVLQALATGREITIDLVCGPSGRLLGMGMRRRLKVRAGEVSIGETIWNEEIAIVCRHLTDLLNPVGPITAQCFLSDSGPLFTEVNGRFGGGLPLSLRAGMDVLPDICRIAAGHSPAHDLLPLKATPGWSMARFDDAIYDSPT